MIRNPNEDHFAANFIDFSADLDANGLLKNHMAHIRDENCKTKLKGGESNVLSHLEESTADTDVDQTPDSTQFPLFVLDRYEIIRKLGEGSFGSVYEVEDRRKSNKRYAMKIISQNIVCKGGGYLKQVKSEDYYRYKI
ncbi:MAG: hypothetical protein MHMPM18_002452 [Marteilia pararefringens]